ncbi:MAG: hypothetical protein LBI42_08450 [Chitinispirillales bacterium]|jgi:hypothetical protein|nr:hypothetical protein [Chitinispirillales bacterium]
MSPVASGKVKPSRKAKRFAYASRIFSPLRLSVLAAAVVGFSKPKGKEAGLLMIQIDGLSRRQLERALENGKMPFISSLIRQKNYSTGSFYSGLPSSTPGVQAELFYGVKNAVPAFGFMHRQSGEVWTMLTAKASSWVQNKLKKQSNSILKGGSAYSDIYNESAAVSGFCSPDMSIRSYLRPFNPLGAVLLTIIHAPTIIRTACLLVIELVVALVDLARGLIQKENILMELSFIGARVGLCVILREAITSSVCIDASRGLPIIHCNFLGYDEQAHRRGPSSRFAHWTLKGIDYAVKRMCMAASRSNRRDYQVWIYSDHGQEKTLSYSSVTGTSVQKAIRELLKKDAGVPRVVSVGPVGHVYFCKSYSNAYLQNTAKLLVEKCSIPLVMMKVDSKKAKAWTRRGVFMLPRDAVDVLGDNHPFLREAARDLAALVHNEDSGDLVICGWEPQGIPLSFPKENGAHAGPGIEETHGFYLVPPAANIPQKSYLRPCDLRNVVIKYFS